MDEEAVGKMLDGICDELKKYIESAGVSLHNDVTTVQSIVEDSALAILLKVDESAQQTEEGIKKAVQENLKLLESKLSEQLKKSFDINSAQAKKENEEILDALKKWQSESRYYARRAEDACTAVQFVWGFIKDSRSSAMQDLEYGRHLLREGDFVGAEKRFESASREVSLKSEANFYNALARCRIQPVWDNYTGSEVPLIHDINSANLSSDSYFQQAVFYETDKNKVAHYNEFAEQVELILREYERIEEENKGGKYDYDCFICVKQSDLNNPALTTDDFEWLKKGKIFDALEKAGIKTFLAERTLNRDLPIEKGTNDYNAFILYALQKAKVLLFICSDSDYAQTPWVKNEYTRYINYHKNPQIVLVGDDRRLKIFGVTGKIQVLPKNDIGKIVRGVRSKVEESKDYVEPEYYYCEKCGRRSPDDGLCTKKYDGVKCNGRLLPAVEYANRRTENAHIKLRDAQKALEQEREKREIAEIEIEKLRLEQPITSEEAAALAEQAKKQMREAELRIIKSEAIKVQLWSEMAKNTELKRYQKWLICRFVFMLLAPPAVILSVFALVSTFYLPLWLAIDIHCRWLLGVVMTLLLGLGIAICILGTLIVCYDGKSEKGRYMSGTAHSVVFLVCLILTIVALVCALAMEIVHFWHHNSALNITMAVSFFVALITPIVGVIINYPKRVMAYVTLALCVLTTVTLGIQFERVSNAELYIYNSSNVSRNLYYYYNSSNESFMVRSIGDCQDSDIVIPSSRYGWKVNSISDNAFADCNNLTSVVIPDSVASIGSGVFEGCSSLTIYCEAATAPYGWNAYWNKSNCPVIWDCKNNDKDKNGYAYAVIDGVRYSLKDGVATVISQPCNISRAVIPESVVYKNEIFSVTGIESGAFSGCETLESVEIPSSVTVIGADAFGYCNEFSIVFTGTTQEWNSIDKDVDWNKNAGNYTVHCTDGDVEKE